MENYQMNETILSDGWMDMNQTAKYFQVTHRTISKYINQPDGLGFAVVGGKNYCQAGHRQREVEARRVHKNESPAPGSYLRCRPASLERTA